MELSTQISQISQISLIPSNDFSQFKNLCFIDQSVESAYNLSAFLNDTTYPIVYTYDSDRESLKTELMTQFANIDRVSFVFHGPPDGSQVFTPKLFINNEPFFSADNFRFLEDLFVSLNVRHADFLACNLLQHQEWKDFFVSIGNGNNVIIVGASDDATGNLKYGGDWTMENTMEDVRYLYFLPSIDNFAGLLLTGTYTDGANSVQIRFITLTSTTAEIIGGDSTISSGTDYSLVIPSTVTIGADVYSVVSIGADAFNNTTGVKTTLKAVTLPSSVTSIGARAFTYNQNMTLDFANTSVVTIGAFAFQYCSNLTTNTNYILTIPATCSSIGGAAFHTTNIQKLICKNGTADTLTIGSYSFYFAPLNNIQIYPRPTISIGNSCFRDISASTTYFIVPTGMTNFVNDAGQNNTDVLSPGLFDYSTYSTTLTVFFSDPNGPPTMSYTAFTSNTSDKVFIYYLDSALTTTGNALTTKNFDGIRAYSKTKLIMISSYDFYVKDTNTVISTPILFNTQTVDFKIVFRYAQSSFISTADITVSNGSLSLMTSTDSGFTYKGTFTPNSNTISATNNLSITANKFAVPETIFGWAQSPTTSLISYAVDTIIPFLSSIYFPYGDCSLSPTFAANTFNYSATKVTVIPYTVTLTPTSVYASSTITVNSNSVTSGSPITLTLNTGSQNTITIIVNDTTTAISNTATYVITFPAVTSQSYNVLSACTTASTNSSGQQRFQTNMDNTTATSPIIQFVQDISQNSTTGYTSNSVTQRFIFGSWALTTPLELNSTVNSTGTSVSSNVKANNFLLYSDVRLKENIEELSEGQGVDDIRVVQYNNKSDNSKHFGVIAHELAEVYPELVQTCDNDMLSVSYIELIPICINEIQLLNKSIEELESRLDELENQDGKKLEN
jgi:hypothetical protein